MIHKEDLLWQYYRSSIANLNGAENCVKLTHIPTNTVIQMDKHRSLHQNRKEALSKMKETLGHRGKKTFPFDFIELQENKKTFTDVIITDTYDDDISVYMLVRCFETKNEILLTKKMKNRDDFHKEIENLSMYFNAKILNPLDHSNNFFIT